MGGRVLRRQGSLALAPLPVLGRGRVVHEFECAAKEKVVLDGAALHSNRHEGARWAREKERRGFGRAVHAWRVVD